MSLPFQAALLSVWPDGHEGALEVGCGQKADELASVSGSKEQPWWFLTYDETVHHSMSMGQKKQLISETLGVRDEGRKERL